MRLAWISVLALTSVGCKFDLPALSGDAAVEPDTGSPDSPPPGFCYGASTGLVKPCFPAEPTGALMLSGTLDTGTSPMCSTTVTQASGLCVIAAADITVESAVNAIGAKPLVLIATKTISVGSGLDAASHRTANAPYMNAQTGAGSDPTGGCNAGTAPGNNGGGAGGSFGDQGGIGGAPNGGAPGTKPTVTTLRGGCRGQDGNVATAGKGGRGGGAIYLIAETSITINAPINASGEGGHPGITGGSGGGGGGSGGMIGLDSPTIMNNSMIFANGASGGEGSGPSNAGNPGPEPNSAAASPAASGGTAAGGDSGGGSGGATTTGGNGINGNGGGGGGGGGGGIGIIRVFRGGPLTGAVSPTPT